MTGPTRPRNRAERRALRERYRRHDVSHVCDALVWSRDGAILPRPEPCGANLVATFVVETGQAVPSVTFLHRPDGSHEPVLSGDGAAATARRTGQIVKSIGGKLQ